MFGQARDKVAVLQKGQEVINPIIAADSASSRPSSKVRSRSLKNGAEGVTHGKIQFAKRRTVDDDGRYIILPKAMENRKGISRVHKFMCKDKKGWNLDPPSLVLSVTGDAGGKLELRPK